MYIYKQVDTFNDKEVSLPITIKSQTELPECEPGYKDPDTGIWIYTKHRVLIEQRKNNI